MKKSLLGLCLAAAVVGTTLMPAVVDAATGGGRGTSIMTVVTKADWSKPGQESVTLASNQLGATGKGVARGVFRVYLDNRFYGTLGNTTGTLGGSLKVNLGRNKTHKIKVVFDEAATKNIYKQITGKNFGNRTPNWYVLQTHKVSNYY